MRTPTPSTSQPPSPQLLAGMFNAVLKIAPISTVQTHALTTIKGELLERIKDPDLYHTETIADLVYFICRLLLQYQTPSDHQSRTVSQLLQNLTQLIREDTRPEKPAFWEAKYQRLQALADTSILFQDPQTITATTKMALYHALQNQQPEMIKATYDVLVTTIALPHMARAQVFEYALRMIAIARTESPHPSWIQRLFGIAHDPLTQAEHYLRQAQHTPQITTPTLIYRLSCLLLVPQYPTLHVVGENILFHFLQYRGKTRDTIAALPPLLHTFLIPLADDALNDSFLPNLFLQGLYAILHQHTDWLETATLCWHTHRTRIADDERLAELITTCPPHLLAHVQHLFPQLPDGLPLTESFWHHLTIAPPTLISAQIDKLAQLYQTYGLTKTPNLAQWQVDLKKLEKNDHYWDILYHILRSPLEAVTQYVIPTTQTLHPIMEIRHDDRTAIEIAEQLLVIMQDSTEHFSLSLHVENQGVTRLKNDLTTLIQTPDHTVTHVSLCYRVCATLFNYRDREEKYISLSNKIVALYRKEREFRIHHQQSLTGLVRFLFFHGTHMRYPSLNIVYRLLQSIAIFAEQDIDTHFESCVFKYYTLRRWGNTTPIFHNLITQTPTAVSPLVYQLCRLSDTDPRHLKQFTQQLYDSLQLTVMHQNQTFYNFRARLIRQIEHDILDCEAVTELHVLFTNLRKNQEKAPRLETIILLSYAVWVSLLFPHTTYVSVKDSALEKAWCNILFLIRAYPVLPTLSAVNEARPWQDTAIINLYNTLFMLKSAGYLTAVKRCADADWQQALQVYALITAEDPAPLVENIMAENQRAPLRAPVPEPDSDEIEPYDSGLELAVTPPRRLFSVKNAVDLETLRLERERDDDDSDSRTVIRYFSTGNTDQPTPSATASLHANGL
ncbi:MAG: hypothetical protein A3J38_08065 [Gammaproteobacteria bacterium RIFCSPHIGHO2_12_FULL_45_9]|nr:MAG: hypothetical protein A3J38_08065 [Gammaproteobacteria bacterium RIFCSPHIGHO2_12_FULL_45_9]